MKKCPFCAEDIQDAAVKCRHCGEKLSTSARQLLEDLAARGINLVAEGDNLTIKTVSGVLSADDEVRIKQNRGALLQVLADPGTTIGAEAGGAMGGAQQLMANVSGLTVVGILLIIVGFAFTLWYYTHYSPDMKPPRAVEMKDQVFHLQSTVMQMIYRENGMVTGLLLSSFGVILSSLGSFLRPSR